jgi:hypothetical protein
MQIKDVRGVAASSSSQLTSFIWDSLSAKNEVNGKVEVVDGEIIWLVEEKVEKFDKLKRH